LPVALQKRARAGIPRLTAVEVHALGPALDGGVEVGVGEDHVRGLAAELARDALQRLAAFPADVAPDGGRAGEGDLGDAGVLDQRGTGGTVARADVEDTVG